MTRAEFQAYSAPPREIGTRMKTVETRDVATPKKSTFLSFDLKDPVTGLRRRKKIICMRDNPEMGNVTQKTHRHYDQILCIRSTYGGLLGEYAA